MSSRRKFLAGLKDSVLKAAAKKDEPDTQSKFWSKKSNTNDSNSALTSGKKETDSELFSRWIGNLPSENKGDTAQEAQGTGSSSEHPRCRDSTTLRQPVITSVIHQQEVTQQVRSNVNTPNGSASTREVGNLSRQSSPARSLQSEADSEFIKHLFDGIDFNHNDLNNTEPKQIAVKTQSIEASLKSGCVSDCSSLSLSASKDEQRNGVVSGQNDGTSLDESGSSLHISIIAKTPKPDLNHNTKPMDTAVETDFSKVCLNSGSDCLSGSKDEAHNGAALCRNGEKTLNDSGISLDKTKIFVIEPPNSDRNHNTEPIQITVQTQSREASLSSGCVSDRQLSSLSGCKDKPRNGNDSCQNGVSTLGDSRISLHNADISLGAVTPKSGRPVTVKRILFTQDEICSPSHTATSTSTSTGEVFLSDVGALDFLPTGISNMDLEVLDVLPENVQVQDVLGTGDHPVSPSLSAIASSPIYENSSFEGTLNLSNSSDGDFNPNSISTAKKKQTRTYNAPDKITRKRVSNPNRWKKNRNKKKLDRGEEYVTLKGKTIRARSLQEPCDDCCRLKCVSKVTEEDRKKVFETFWKKVPNKQGKWLFLNGLTQTFEKERSSTQEKSRRTYSRKYFLPVNKDRVQVCKVMFLATFDISDGQVSTAVKKGKGSPDKRGKNPRPTTCTVSPALKESVRNHIQSLPRMPSHYVRKDSQKEFLTGNVESIAQLHDMYLEWMSSNYPDEQKLATYRQYSDIFNTEFNIGFFLAKKDQCDLCVQYDNSSEAEKLKLQEIYDDHSKNNTLAQDLRLADTQVAKKESNALAVFCFDYEKTLICPKAKASVFYYRRKLSVNNFTVARVGKKNEEICYVYDETVAHKGSNEVASFLWHFMESKVEEGVTDFRMYCDNCWGQNKNKAVAAFLAAFTQKFKDKNVKVVLRYLEKGHSYNSADNVHSLNERKTRKRDIYTPDEWYECIEKAKRSKTSPIKVIKVQQNMIFDWKELADKLNFNKDTEGKTIPFSKIREIRPESTKPLQLNYKLSLDEKDPKVISLKKVGKPVNLETYELKRAINDDHGPFPISKKKKEDLLYYCSHNLIPQEHQDFFKNLPAGENENDNENENENDDDTIILHQPAGRERKRKPRQAASRNRKKKARLSTEEEEEEEVDDLLNL